MNNEVPRSVINVVQRRFVDSVQELKDIILLVLLFLLIPSPVRSTDNITVAASILRGEAPQGCERCRELTACAIVEDMQHSIELADRWYGWRTARQSDVALIKAAMNTDLCDGYPSCKFVGNGRDLEVWAKKGWVPESVRIVAYCGEHGCSVCVPK